MRTALIILIGIHGIIHLLGFLKAFDLYEFNSISRPISTTSGIIWLLAFILFVTTAISILLKSDYSWVSGLLAVIISQALIFNNWSDARFGTLLNIIILFVAIVSYSTYSFKNKVSRERTVMFENSTAISQKTVTEKNISDLPPIVQKWLRNSGIIDKIPISNVHLVQDLQLKMTPDQKDWSPGIAEQYFTIKPPAFNWNIKTQMNSILDVVGRDKFENGNGEMTIRLFSLVSVADAKQNGKVNQATLQRYLAEIVWFPSASLSPYIIWEPIDKNSAKATISIRGTIGSGIFYFEDNGNFLKFTAMRFKDVKDKDPKLWTVSAIKTEERNGIKIPVELIADWDLDNGKWNWLKLKIKSIDYNVEKMPVTNNVLRQ